MDHDFHCIVEFDKRGVVIFRKLDAAKANFAIHYDERDRFNCFALARPVDA
jgi:hypothetical protein